MAVVNAMADPDAIMDPAAVELFKALLAVKDRDSANPGAVELVYGSVDEFYREFLRWAYARPIDGTSLIWAADWYNYNEARIRIEALWRSWEFLRNDPATGISVWYRDHADHHMPVLMDPDGPFASCERYDGANTARAGEPLPYIPPDPPFPDVRG
jgi:hypothetical protein